MSGDKKHDQTFVKLVLEEMIGTVENIPESCVIESDNCSSQYKSAQHFDDLQYICNKIGAPIIRLFSVAGHGKGEVDHVGGLAKCALRRYVGTGGTLLNATHCKNFLETKFSDKTNPKFFCKQIDIDDLANSRADARLKKYPTIEGSDSFQVMLFYPNSTTFKAASHLCICENCSITYGSCSLFTSYELRTVQLKKIFLCSEEDVQGQMSDEPLENDPSEFLIADTYCAVRPDSLWFIKVKDSCETNIEVVDDYGNIVAPGMSYIEGRFMERVDILSKGYLYKLSKKKTLFFQRICSLPLCSIHRT